MGQAVVLPERIDSDTSVDRRPSTYRSTIAMTRETLFGDFWPSGSQNGRLR